VLGLPDNPSVLHIGKDARTDALGAGCAASSRRPEMYGISEFNPPGMLDRSTRFVGDVSLTDLPELVRLTTDIRPDLAVIGPEEPLCAGLVDKLDELGVPSFGPSRELARIEASKSWARTLLATYGIAGNPEFRVFRDSQGLERYLRQLGEFVVKPDGLTGGKGVRVSGEHLGSVAAGAEYAGDLIEAAGSVVIEERLDGEEFSLQTITDGETVVHCPLVQDHKRAGVGDHGPNTGGMGSYSCADHALPFVSSGDVSAAQSINEAVIRALKEEVARPYRGVLYGGFMATADGVRVVEYNARFGDPEAMNVLPVLEGDLLDVCWATATGQLAEVPISFQRRATVCKYIVPAAYPSGKGAGDQVDCARLYSELDRDVRLYWAAVNRVGRRVLMTGSRALALVGIGDSVGEAEIRAEHAASLVRGPVKHRADIGTADLIERRVEHMRAVRGFVK
jgi:phosphoribosylamine--glycine ligase